MTVFVIVNVTNQRLFYLSISNNNNNTIMNAIPVYIHISRMSETALRL